MGKRMNADIVDLTPSWAEDLLKANHPDQRPISRVHVMKLTHAMRHGQWRSIGDPIRIDSHGRLVDGQHRCSAVVNSGVTIPNQLLVEVSDDEAIRWIDQNQKIRNANDIQRALGVKMHGTVRSAILHAHYDFARYTQRRDPRAVQVDIANASPHADALKSLHSIHAREAIPVYAGHLAGYVYCAEVNPGAAREFFESVARNDPRCHTARLLIQSLLRTRQGGYKKGGEQAAQDQAERAVRAYNAWRSGQSLKRLHAGGSGVPEALE